mmetsp:Transcript_6918/g.9590  ORF Transcript_6918/g.9590 Transcript_6918/m.9590 type:complete len:184 (+) Transcript_6918:438-989(+)
MELAEKVVVLRHRSLTFKHLDQDTRLIVGICCEGLAFLGRDGRVALDELGHHSTGSLEAHGQGGDIQQKQVLNLGGTLTGQDGSLHRGTECNGFIWVDRLARFLAVEELLDHCLHLGDTSGSTNEHNLVHIALVNATVTHALLHRAHGVAEVVHAQFLESRTGQGAVVVDALIEGINFNGSLR